MKLIWEISYDVYLDDTGASDPVAEGTVEPEQLPTELRSEIEQWILNLLRHKYQNEAIL